MKEELLKGNEGDAKLSKREEKRINKLIKEKDKLERDAMVQRIKEKDMEKNEKKLGNVVIGHSALNNE